MIAALLGTAEVGTALALDEVARQEAVHHEVGVAAYGRGEVRVALEAEAVVPDVRRRIARLGHRADGEHGDHRLLGTPLDGGEQLVEALSHGLTPTLPAQLVAEGADEVGQTMQLLLIGRLVDAIDEGRCFALEAERRLDVAARSVGDALGHSAIGQQHELLDELVGGLALLDDDL